MTVWHPGQLKSCAVATSSVGRSVPQTGQFVGREDAIRVGGKRGSSSEPQSSVPDCSRIVNGWWYSEELRAHRKWMREVPTTEAEAMAVAAREAAREELAAREESVGDSGRSWVLQGREAIDSNAEMSLRGRPAELNSELDELGLSDLIEPARRPQLAANRTVERAVVRRHAPNSVRGVAIE